MEIWRVAGHAPEGPDRMSMKLSRGNETSLTNTQKWCKEQTSFTFMPLDLKNKLEVNNAFTASNRGRLYAACRPHSIP
eukprot:scaffold145496_cov15-Tisochrysis_lutea.AAC.1